jgi:hypothetical protein
MRSCLPLLLPLMLPAVGVGSSMPVSQQNALIQKYCAVCHTDAVRNGGLTLQHFDAAHVAPSLAAMLASKITGGVALETVRAAGSSREAADLLSQKMKTGAMAAAGIPIPDRPTIDALIAALADEAKGAENWAVTQGPAVTASILREVSQPGNPGGAESYRLTLSCNGSSHEGEMQLAWAPATKRGTLSVTFDGSAPAAYKVEGSEHMGDGSKTVTGPAAVTLSRTALPRRTLSAGDLFEGESVEFPLSDLPETARRSLESCFTPRTPSPDSRYRQ